jgi:hypothetical protein
MPFFIFVTDSYSRDRDEGLPEEEKQDEASQPLKPILKVDAVHSTATES